MRQACTGSGGNEDEGGEILSAERMGVGRSLVVGAFGQVGQQMAAALARRNAGVLPLRSSRVEREGWLRMDLAELAEVSHAAAVLDAQALDAVYCVGGMTYVDGCEAEPELAHRVNARGPGVLAEYAHARRLPFVYYSTEYVFAGRAELPGPYTEHSPTEPLSVYGRSKLAGEELVMRAHPDALVLRTTVVYGRDEQRKNFVYTVRNMLGEGKPMRIAEDQISTPTYNRDLAEATLALVEGGASGVFHVAGPELMGRMEFARVVAEVFGLDAGLLEGATTASLRQIAARPLAAGLDSSKMARMFPEVRMRGLREGLADVFGEM